MILQSISIDEIHRFLNPLVISGLYKNESVALRDIITDFIYRKLESYKNISNSFEKKYNYSFSNFSEKIKGNASMTDEDDWFEWKASIEMYNAWNSALQNITNYAIQHR